LPRAARSDGVNCRAPFGRRELLLFGSRSWDANFFANYHDALRSGIRVEARLDTEDCNLWLERVRAQVPKPAPPADL